MAADPTTAEGTVVIDNGSTRRMVRRPLDLARFVVSVLVTGVIVVTSYFATGTAAGLGTDVSSGARLLPSLILVALNIIGGIGTLGLPIAVIIALVMRRRGRQLVDALVALLVAIGLLTLATYLLTNVASPQLLAALAGSTSQSSVATAPILGGLVAFVTVTRLMSRRPWNVLAVIVLGSQVIVTVVSADIALAGVAVSLSIGWAVGLLVRYLAGTPTTRPSGLMIAQALARGGHAVTMLEARESTARGRRYLGTTADGRRLLVTVLDRDREGAGLVNSAWTSLRLRDDSVAGAFNMQGALDHAALMSYSAQAAGAPTPQLLLATEINPDSVLLAHDLIDGTRFANLDDVADDDLRGAWQAVRKLHANQVTHRSLSSRHLLRGSDGKVWLIGGEAGSIAAGDVARRIDVAELLCTLAMLTDVERSIATGIEVLGAETIGKALPALQPVALSKDTRKEIRRHKDLLLNLRDRLAEIRPDAQTEQIQLERVRPRTVLMIVAGTIAGYVLISQLTNVDLASLFSNANWGWVAAGLVLTVITFIGAAWSLSGFVPERIPLHRTTLAQVSGSFATLVSPPTVGVVAINVRFLQRAGLHPALAAASVGLSQVIAFIIHLLLLLGFGVVAGTQAEHAFNPPQFVVIGIAVLAVAVLILLTIPYVRRVIATRVGPLMKEVVPRLVTVLQRPAKLLEGIGGILVLNFAFIGVLYASVQAFGGTTSFAVVAVVYLAGSTIGQVAPTPGGLGGVEAALAAGLTAGGLDAGLAVSAVLLYRLMTFWLPTIPGYWAFNWLTKKGAL